MEDDKRNLNILMKGPIFDCKNDVEVYQCGDCNEYNSNFLVDVRQHNIRDNHPKTAPDEVVYKCLNCNLVAYSKYLFLLHSFFSSCALGNERQRKKRFVRCKVVKPENSLNFENDFYLDSANEAIAQKPSGGHFASQIISESDLQEYMTTHITSRQFNYVDDIKWFDCDQCPSRYRHATYLLAHEKRCHINPKDICWFRCKECPSKFKTRPGLNRHLISHMNPEDIPWFKCEHCPSKFKQKAHLKSHTASYHSSKYGHPGVLQCAQCHSNFKKPGCLVRHMLLCPIKSTKHSKSKDDRRFLCTHCGLKYTRKHVLDRHIKTIHSKPEEIQWFQCEQCPSKFKQKGHLNAHVFSVHSKEGLPWLQCEQCPSKFREKGKLNKHIITRHTVLGDIQWFACEHCSKKFRHESHLKGHITLYHTKEPHLNRHGTAGCSKSKDVQWLDCEHCSKKFRSRFHLKRHITCCHTKPEDIDWFNCDQCPLKFKQNAHLKSHVMTRHSRPEAVKYLVCEYCSSNLKNKASLRTHIRTCHPKPEDVPREIQWHGCEICRKRFKTKFDLRRHVTSCLRKFKPKVEDMHLSVT